MLSGRQRFDEQAIEAGVANRVERERREIDLVVPTAQQTKVRVHLVELSRGHRHTRATGAS